MPLRIIPGIATKADSVEESRAISHAIAASGTTRGNSLVGSFRGWDFEEALQKAFLTSPWVYRCISLIATSQARIPIVLKRGDGDSAEVVQDANLYRLLNRRPNSYQSAFRFRYALSCQLLLSQRGAFIEIVRDNSGDIHSLHLLPPHLVEPIRDKEEFVSYYRLWNPGTDWTNNNRDFSKLDKNIPKEKIIWVMINQDPANPYQQTTPLMTLGQTIQNDILAQMFNSQFLANDGRPGTLVGIKGQVDSVVAEEIKSKFQGSGGLRAGETLVIDGAENIDVKDMSASPRDLQWVEMMTLAKNTILALFGVSETVMAQAAGRTLDNADAEYEAFWVQTMLPHCDVLAAELDILTGEVSDDLILAFDYTQVDVLQRAKKNRDAKTMQEYQVGSISLNEFRKETGKQEIDHFSARLIYADNGVIIGSDEDLAKVDELQTLGITESAAQSEIEAQTAPEAPMAAGTATVPPAASQGTPQALVNQQAADTVRTQRQAVFESLMSGKVPTKSLKNAEEKVDYPFDEVDRANLEGQVEGILTTWSSRQLDVVLSRLDHVKFRKGTRHDLELKGEAKAIDASYAIDVQKWSDDANADLAQLIAEKVRIQTTRAARDMVNKGMAIYPGRNAWEKVFGSKETWENIQHEIVQDILRIISNSTLNQSNNVLNIINKLDNDGASLDEIKKEISKMMNNRSSWRKHLAATISTMAIEGSKDRTYKQNGDIVKKWNTAEDEKVRPTHAEKHGEVKNVFDTFDVGGMPMQYPGDPTGGPAQTANCRCSLSY